MKKITCLLLFLIGLGLLIIYFSYDIDYLCNVIHKTNIDKSWWSNALLNVGAGLITSILVIVFYDLVILRDDKNERKRRNQIALDALRDLLMSHFEGVLFGMYRAAVKEEKTFKSLTELFTEDYFKGIENLDFNKSPWADGQSKYCNIIPEMNGNFSKYLREEVVQFGQYLDPKIIELVREIRFSKFMKESVSLPNMAKLLCQINVQGNITQVKAQQLVKQITNSSPNGFPWKYHELFYEGLREHVIIFQQLVELHDKYTSKIKLIPNLLTPNTGDVTTGCCSFDCEQTPDPEINKEKSLD